MTRAEHMRWAKSRALEYVERGEFQNAVASMLSDLNKHPETERQVLGCGLASVIVVDADSARKWIEGCDVGGGHA